MSFAMNGIALIMELINRYATEKRVKNVRYPDPWVSTYTNFQGDEDGEDKE